MRQLSSCQEEGGGDPSSLKPQSNDDNDDDDNNDNDNDNDNDNNNDSDNNNDNNNDNDNDNDNNAVFASSTKNNDAFCQSCRSNNNDNDNDDDNVLIASVSKNNDDHDIVFFVPVGVVGEAANNGGTCLRSCPPNVNVVVQEEGWGPIVFEAAKQLR